MTTSFDDDTTTTAVASRLLCNHIGGEWVPASDGATFVDLNPTDTSDEIGRFPESTREDSLAAVAAAVAAASSWEELGPIARGEILFTAAHTVLERKEELAAIITREQGKTLAEARDEVQRSADILRFTAGEGRRIHGSTLPADSGRTLAMTWRKPLGVVALITPWNFPVAIPVWKMAPALLSGCTAVIKPSPLAPLCTAAIVDVMVDAGVPAGVLNLVQGDREAGETLTAHPDVRGISFTGSLSVGQSIQKAAAGRLARTQLELGGKNAVIVLADADLDAAADAIVHGAFGQAGQRCSATSRVLVERSIREELVAGLTSRIREFTLGDPAAEGTTLGPVVDAGHLEACLSAVEGAVAEGATLVTGGERATDGELESGFFMQPTVLVDVPRDSWIGTEEVFGPVLSVIDVDGFEDSMTVSNSVVYGMSGAIFTNDRGRVYDALDRFEVGMLHVNRPGVGSWPHMPHTGAKLSQHGPPECSAETLDFYTQWRSACVAFPG